MGFIGLLGLGQRFGPPGAPMAGCPGVAGGRGWSPRRAGSRSWPFPKGHGPHAAGSGLSCEHRVPGPPPPVRPTGIDHSTVNVGSPILTRMYFMYVDDGGDPGLSPSSPTRHFVLSGLVLHELRWRQFADGVLNFRQRMRHTYGLPVRTEIHAAEYISRGSMTNIPRYNRLAILRHFTDHLASQNYLSVTNVVVNKVDKPADYDVFTSAWRTLFQRFENTLNHRNFPGPKNPEDKGIVFVDNTDGGSSRVWSEKWQLIIQFQVSTEPATETYQ